jgi:hypothetical protein
MGICDQRTGGTPSRGADCSPWKCKEREVDEQLLRDFGDYFRAFFGPQRTLRTQRYEC